MKAPLCIDLFCGCFGWSAGWLELGGRVVGFDLDHQPYHGPVPQGAQLVLQDVLTLHGSQFRDASLILASPPCTEFSFMAMPWKRAKEKARLIRESPDEQRRLTALFDACFRIQREAIEAAGHHIPLVVENVCGAQKWVGRARWHYGSFYLWGDVPALMPMTKRWKVGGFRFDGSGGSFQTASVKATKNDGGSWFNVAHNTTSGHGQNPDGRPVKGAGGGWFNDNKRAGKEDATGYLSRSVSKSTARKAASAHIARIPFELASYIARAWKPTEAVAR